MQGEPLGIITGFPLNSLEKTGIFSAGGLNQLYAPNPIDWQQLVKIRYVLPQTFEMRPT